MNKTDKTADMPTVRVPLSVMRARGCHESRTAQHDSIRCRLVPRGHCNRAMPNAQLVRSRVSKAPLHDALAEILNASNLTWKYLNGGTHEEENRDEFDQVEVELVVSRLERIDALDLRTCR